MEQNNNNNKNKENSDNNAPVIIPNNIPTEPPLGTYASTARIMVEIFPDFDWDAWKDEMKDQDF